MVCGEDLGGTEVKCGHVMFHFRQSVPLAMPELNITARWIAYLNLMPSFHGYFDSSVLATA